MTYKKTTGATTGSARSRITPAAEDARCQYGGSLASPLDGATKGYPEDQVRAVLAWAVEKRRKRRSDPAKKAGVRRQAGLVLEDRQAIVAEVNRDCASTTRLATAVPEHAAAGRATAAKK
jgi:hypothetical protein